MKHPMQCEKCFRVCRLSDSGKTWVCTICKHREKANGGQSVTKLHELPPDHRLRNVAIQDIDVRIKCRHTGSTRDPRTWKIKNDTFNRLCESWQTNFDFIVQ